MKPTAEFEADAALIQGVRSLIPSAMDEFTLRLAAVPKFIASLNARAGHRLRSDELCDVVQDTQLAILGALDRYRPFRPLRAWVWGICKNQYRTALRKKHANAKRFRSLEQGEDTMFADSQNDDWDNFERLLEAVGGKEAEIIRLKHRDGLTFQEIAERQELPQGTVKTRYYEGIDRLRRRMGKEDK